jgi:hypothetical protein
MLFTAGWDFAALITNGEVFWQVVESGTFAACGNETVVTIWVNVGEFFHL